MDARWVCATCKSEHEGYETLVQHVVEAHGWKA